MTEKLRLRTREELEYVQEREAEEESVKGQGKAHM